VKDGEGPRGGATRGHDPAAYGEQIADEYDARFPAVRDDDPAIDFLVEEARGGPVLELGIGTGRLALPLARRGVVVHGIDATPSMVERLRAKPGGAAIPVTLGDFREAAAPGPDYALVFVAFNTLFGLLTPEEQVAAFRAASARLRAGGAFVVEAFVPDLARFDRGRRVSTDSLLPDGVRIEASVHDPAAQRIDVREATFVHGAPPRVLSFAIRYAWPSELDLMARLAGLEPESRFGSWGRAPFDARSRRHVSVYRNPSRA
jgi:SAM-dependent methyltransferase